MATGPRPSDSVPDLIKKCQKAASDKQYNVALDIANAAVQSFGRDPTVPLQNRVTLLDLRTSLRIRMEDYDLALKDAKRMLLIDRADGRGYIRCGQIEKLKGNKALAATFYEHGLKHIAVSDRYHQLIAKELVAVKEELRAINLLAKAKDPMTTLPLEVVEIILSYVSYREHMKLLRVNKAWNRLVCSRSPITDTLAFPGANKPVTPKMLHTTFRRLKRLKTLSAQHLNVASSQIICKTLQLPQRLPELQHLEICDKWIPITEIPLSNYNLRSLVLGPETETPFDVIPTVLQTCSSLEVAKFGNVTGPSRADIYLDRKSIKLESNTLQVLNIHVLKALVIEFKHNMLFSGLPRLEALSCAGLSCFEFPLASQPVDFRHMSRLETLELERCTMPPCALPPSLRRIRFTEVVFEEHSMQAVQDPASQRPPPEHTQLVNLESLIVWDCPMFPMFIHHPAQTAKPGTLEEFILGVNVECIPSYMVLFATGWAKGLKRIRIKGECITDIAHRMFLEHCPALEELCLDGAMVTGLFVSDFLRGHPQKLRKITFRNCKDMSYDVIPWAKERGVEVKVIRDHKESRGRRVRYDD